MNIIYITSQGQDNLEDALLHGFRSLFGEDCIDYPKKESMYRGFIPTGAAYGGLFTIWRTLDDILLDRKSVPDRVRTGDYDLMVFGSIHRNEEQFKRFKPYLQKDKTILIDGEDHVRMKSDTAGFLYFKRELHQKIWYYYSHKVTPKFIYTHLSPPKNILPTAFAIPKEKITFGIQRSDKKTLLPLHIVDEEIRRSSLAPDGAKGGAAFHNEEEYYQNLQLAKFGITTKRGGWDCLRHYEIAANGAGMCFRDLDKKTKYSAPHGLNSTNTIMYSSARDLQEQIEKLSDSQYDRLLENGYQWISRQTTEFRVKEIMDAAKKKFLF